MSTRHFDVLVVGGGLAGLAFAVLLRAAIRARRPEFSIGILEQQSPVQSGADIGLRVLAIAPSSSAILASCGAWQRLPAGRAAPYRRMRVWQAAGTPPGGPLGPGSLLFDAAELGEAELGHIVESDLLRQLLWESMEAGGGIDVVTGAPVTLDRTTAPWSVQLAGGDTLVARLIVGADGADSWVRNQLGLPAGGHAYDQRAIVAHVASERPHEDTAWQCFLPGGPVALLPLADGRSSVVWSCPDALAAELLACPAAEFAARLTAATGGALGALRLTTGRAGFPLAARHTHQYTGAGFALIGDAIHQVHPLAGQGINLGFLDAAALAEVLAAHLNGTRLADPGDPAVLRRYERWRKGPNLLTLGAMDGLHKLFTGTWPAAPRLGALGLAAVNRLPGLKRLLAQHALGRGMLARHRTLL